MNFGLSIILLALSLFFSFSTRAQDLMKEKIWKVTSKKRSLFLKDGVFFSGKKKIGSNLRAVRHRFDKKDDKERVVFDFSTKEIPSIYGHIASGEKKVYIDFFNTGINPKIASLGNSKYVDRVNFYPISNDSLSIEIIFKNDVGLDVFFLENPGRLVIDIKK